MQSGRAVCYNNIAKRNCAMVRIKKAACLHQAAAYACIITYDGTKLFLI